MKTGKLLFLLTCALLCAGLLFSGCKKKSGTSASGSQEDKMITLLVDKDGDLRGLEAVVKEIEQRFGIRTEIEIRPAGTEGDNIIKTRLATGDMADVFMYNTGSLLQAINPERYIYEITNEPFAAQVTDDFKRSASVNSKLFAVPSGSSMAGAILYNKVIYRELGLSVPHTWKDFIANCTKIQAAGKTAVIGSLKDTWTSQLYFLGDEYNVKAAYPTWPEEYTANKAKYATNAVARRGFEKTADIRPFLNRDYLATGFDQAAEMIGNGEGAHWAITSGALSVAAAANPDKINDIGMFGVPGEDPNNHGLTVWLSGGAYIYKNTPRLELAKQWVGFYISQEGISISTQVVKPNGPFSVKGITLPDSVYAAVKEMQIYFDQGKTDVALEFESPVKGPNLEQILVEVMSGSTPPQRAAEAYDQDVTKQAIQLGLSGW